MRRNQKFAGAAFGAVAVLAFSAGPAMAAGGSVHANLRSIPGSGVHGSGTAMVKVSGHTITVTMAAMGLLPNQPHAAHIHFGVDAQHDCPNLSDDKNGNGHLNTSEGLSSYGPIVVSLTKTGDTSPNSALDVKRFSTAPGGKISYERGSIHVSSEVANAITDGKSVVVIHGVDYNHDGKYDGKTKSDLNPALPTEATDPALCGVLTKAPSGGMQTGQGGAAGGPNNALIALGGSALVAAAGAGGIAARRAHAHA